MLGIHTGFQFLPVDKATFLTIQYLVNTVRSQLPLVQASAVMFNGQLIWSGINQDDMFLLYLLDQVNAVHISSIMLLLTESSAPSIECHPLAVCRMLCATSTRTSRITPH